MHAKIVLKEHGQRRQGPVVARSPAPSENMVQAWDLHQRAQLAIFVQTTNIKTILVKTNVGHARMRDILAPGNPDDGRITRVQTPVTRRRISFVLPLRTAPHMEA